MIVIVVEKSASVASNAANELALIKSRTVSTDIPDSVVASALYVVFAPSASEAVTSPVSVKSFVESSANAACVKVVRRVDKGENEMFQIVNCTNSDGFTPLHLAASESHAPLIEILIKFGA